MFALFIVFEMLMNFISADYERASKTHVPLKHIYYKCSQLYRLRERACNLLTVSFNSLSLHSGLAQGKKIYASFVNKYTLTYSQAKPSIA